MYIVFVFCINIIGWPFVSDSVTILSLFYSNFVFVLFMRSTSLIIIYYSIIIILVFFFGPLLQRPYVHPLIQQSILLLL